jgi:TPP-dependent pyruvate/acetoin dehydrogenase alpha subunit
MFAEFYGKATGSSAGKAGHQEIGDVSANIYSGPILAGQLPIAAGVAWTFQARQQDRVAVVVLGDGSADGGIVYETLNFAALKRLPLLFICENNLYSTYSPQSARQAVCNIAGRANVFGVPARRLYGNDVAAVYKAARVAVARARRGDGPSFLELVTYRWCGHVGPEDDDYLGYRPAEELKAWQKRCPIEALKRRLLERELIDYSYIESIELNITAAIQDAFAFAKSSPFPEPGELLTHNFAGDSHRTHEQEHPVPGAIFDFHQAESRPRPY